MSTVHHSLPPRLGDCYAKRFLSHLCAPHYNRRSKRNDIRIYDTTQLLLFHQTSSTVSQRVSSFLLFRKDVSRGKVFLWMLDDDDDHGSFAHRARYRRHSVGALNNSNHRKLPLNMFAALLRLPS